MALEQEALHVDPEDTLTWSAKPKLHYLGHILDEGRKGHRPKDSWAYRDETEGFQFQKLFHKRGGQPKLPDLPKIVFFWKQRTHHVFLLNMGAQGFQATTLQSKAAAADIAMKKLRVCM